jgi:hypothetical protein
LLTFALHTKGARRIPADAEFRVYLDYDRDGTIDEVIYNTYAANLPLTSAFDRKFIVVHTTVEPNSLRPDYLNTLVKTKLVLFQTFDVEEQTTFLSVPVDELNDGHLDFSTGNASFDFGAAVVDLPQDFAVAGSFPGYDLAPDGLDALTPALYHFTQPQLDCLHYLTPRGPDGSIDLGRLGGQLITVPGGLTEDVALASSGLITLACQPARARDVQGVMLANLDNAQGGDSTLEIRRIHVNAPPGSLPWAVYLPWLNQ